MRLTSLETGDPAEQKERIRYRIQDQGYNWLKMDVSIGEIMDIPGCIVNPEILKGNRSQWS